MSDNLNKALKFKELAYLYVDTVYPYMVSHSIKYHDSKYAEQVSSKLIRAAHNSIAGKDLAIGNPEDVFKETVRLKRVMEKNYPPVLTSEPFDYEIDDFYVKVLSRYLDLFLPDKEPYDIKIITKVDRMRRFGESLYTTGTSGEALLESVTDTGIVDRRKIATNLSDEEKKERLDRWKRLTSSLEFSKGTDEEYLKLADEYLETVIPYMVFFSMDVSKDEVDAEIEFLINSGKAAVLEKLYSPSSGKSLFDAAVAYKVGLEEKVAKRNNLTWTIGPAELEKFYIQMLNKLILTVDDDREIANRKDYINEVSSLYSIGYSAEAIFESFCNQPLDSNKKTANLSVTEMVDRGKTYEFIMKKAQ